MGAHKEIRVYKDLFNRIFAASTTYTASTNPSVPGVAVDMGTHAQNGFFSLHVDLRGGDVGGQLSAGYEVSHTGTSFVTPTGATNIFTTFTAASGPKSDGVDIYSFTPPLSRFLRILVWESNGTAVSGAVHLAVQ